MSAHLTAFAGKLELDSGLRSATSRGAYALAQLAAATLSERLERMTDLARSLATRVRFAELVAAGFLDTVAKIGLYWVLTNRTPQ